jgi:hypothetical protein
MSEQRHPHEPVLAPNPDGVPLYLTALPRWLLWRIVLRRDRKTGELKPTKPPISFHDSKICTAHDPLKWTTFNNVVTAVSKSRAWDGYGIELGEIPGTDEWLIGIDLDECLDEDDVCLPWAMPFLVAMASYAERSPGGAGLKSFARIRSADMAAVRKLLDIPDGDREQARTRPFGAKGDGEHAPGVQLFLSLRYFTVTGHRWAPAPEDVALLSLGQVAQLAHLFGPRKQRTAPKAADRLRAQPASAREMGRRNRGVGRYLAFRAGHVGCCAADHRGLQQRRNPRRPAGIRTRQAARGRSGRPWRSLRGPDLAQHPRGAAQ